MREKTHMQDAQDPVEALLPWHAAGTLDPATANRVEEALARDSALQASLRLIQEDRAETIAMNQSLGAPGGDVWARVLAAAQAEPRKPSLGTALATLGALIGLWGEHTRSRIAWARAVAAMVILVQGATIVYLLPATKDANYQTASEQSALSDGTTVLVSFAPEARLNQVVQLLQKRGASIIEGPRGGGMFRVRVGGKGLTSEQLGAIVADLRSEPNVRLVLPSTAQ